MIGKQKIWILHIFLLLSLLLAGCTTTDIFESSMITGAAIGVNEPVGMFAAPVVDTLVLNSTDLSNDTNQNLTAYVETSDGDGDSVHNIITWNLNGTPQLLLYYPFEGSNSTIFFSNSTDYAGFNNNMTTKSGSSIRYRISGGYNKSGAWNFSGSNLQRGAGFSTTLGAMNYSVEAWVRTNSSVEHQPILDMGVKDFTFAIANGSIIRIFDGAGAETYFSNDGLTISDNSWHHVAAVREGLGANELKFYLDGVSVGSSTQSTIITNPGTMSIGGDTFSYFYGDIDELKLWNRSLTQQQIQAIFQNQTDVIVSQELNSGDN